MRFRDGKVVTNLSLIDSFDAIEQVIGHPLVQEPDLDDVVVAVDAYQIGAML
jgi:hypothetical protein